LLQAYVYVKSGAEVDVASGNHNNWQRKTACSSLTE